MGKVLVVNLRDDLIGEIAVLDRGQRSATAIALEDTDTLSLPGPKVREFMAQNPEAAMKIIGVLC